MEEQTKADFKVGLGKWFEQNAIKLPEFAQKMDYSYQSAWNLVRGSSPVTVEAIGRFVLAFGPEETARMLDLAGYSYS